MASTPIDTYRLQIQRELQAGNATEHTHRPALKALIETLVPGVTATNEPRRVECGAPDYVISRESPHGPVTLGYVEAKDVDKPLGEIERSDQIKRYLSALPNLILADYLEFRWYVSGEHRQTARLARVSKGKLTPEKNGAEAVTGLLTEFLSREAEQITDPKTLVLRMARLTHFIRDMIVTAFESKSASGTLTDLRGAFEKALIPDLRIPQFADMFAQTLAYGLFAARCNHHGPKGSFKRFGAASEIPKTNPFLRQLEMRHGVWGHQQFKPEDAGQQMIPHIAGPHAVVSLPHEIFPDVVNHGVEKRSGPARRVKNQNARGCGSLRGMGILPMTADGRDARATGLSTFVFNRGSVRKAVRASEASFQKIIHGPHKVGNHGLRRVIDSPRFAQFGVIGCKESFVKVDYGILPGGPLAEVGEHGFHVRIGQELSQVIHESHIRLFVKGRACDGFKELAKEGIGFWDFRCRAESLE